VSVKNSGARFDDDSGHETEANVQRSTPNVQRSMKILNWTLKVER
jgi:hypothetical protein